MKKNKILRKYSKSGYSKNDRIFLNIQKNSEYSKREYLKIAEYSRMIEYVLRLEYSKGQIFKNSENSELEYSEIAEYSWLTKNALRIEYSEKRILKIANILSGNIQR